MGALVTKGMRQVLRRAAAGLLVESCAIKRAADNWQATVATVACCVGGYQGPAGSAIPPLSDDPTEPIWVFDEVQAVVTDRLIVAGRGTFEVLSIPAHRTNGIVRRLDCVAVRPQGVPS